MAQTVEEITKIAGLEVVEAQESDDFIKLLVYGDAGAGKTWLVASAADVEAMQPVLFIDMEGGISSVKRKWPGMHVIRIKDTPGKMAWEHLYELYEHLKTKPHPYKTIVLDSITEAYALCMRWVMHLLLQRKPDRDPDIADKREYAKARSRVHLMIRSFRDLNANVLMTALKDVKSNNDTGAIINYIPGLPGKLAYEVGAFMDELLYLFIEAGKDGVTRKLLTVPANKYLAKDRSDSLPTMVESPTMQMLFAAMTGKEDLKATSEE